MRAPAHLWRAWPRVARRIRAARRRALFTDLDGTLAPIRQDARAVKLLPGVRRLLRRAARRGDVVGVISGRQVRELQRLVGVRGIWYAGTHGHFIEEPAGRRRQLLGPAQKRVVARMLGELRSGLRGLRGIRIEPKDGSVSVHYRGAPAAGVARARRVVRGVLRAQPGAYLQPGKKVWELLAENRAAPRGLRRVDKGAALEFIRGREPALDLVCFLGDDATDERAFEKNRAGLSILVGRRRRSAAKYYLRSPREVRRFLERWLECAEPPKRK